MALWCAGPAVGAPGLPLRDGRPVVASVGGDPIWLDELARELGATADRARLQQGRATPAELEVLDRLVTVRLIVKEATAMGLADAPEIRKQVEVTSREILREVLFARLTAGLTPDPAVVDRVYKDLVREWKTSALLFEDKAAAERARKEIAAGAAFDQVAARALSSKAARPNGDNDYHPKSAYLPQVAGALATLAAGQVSPVIQIPSGFVVLRVVDVRYPQNAEALAEARKQALVERQEKTLRAHEAALRRQYVTLHKAVLDSIDYEAPKPGLNALLKDKRVIADIKGSQPVTVADLTDYLRMQFFHGTDDPRERRRMNSLKGSALDAMIGRRLSNAEAVRIGIDRTPEYRERVRGYRDSLVFDAFVQKVIVPPNKMTETEVRKYYDTHLKEYSSPEMLRVRGLAFTRRAAAEDAARKLREGADFGWLSAHAEGQAPKGTDGLLTFDGRPLIVGSLPEGLRKALAGARAGESRLYASPEGPAYVLAVQGVVPPTPQPYEQVRDEIAKKLYNEKLKKAVAAYADRLRAQTKVETYLTRVR
jgi:parvulin-like peptidyl-prolyl isomerase